MSKDMPIIKVTVLGAGAFGSALACISARAGHQTTLWGRDKDTIDEINTRHTNSRYLNDLVLQDEIHAENDIAVATKDSDLLLLAVPAQSIGTTLKLLDGKISSQCMIISCAKGIDRETGLLASQMVGEAFPDHIHGALSGPSFASDMVRGLPTAVTVATNDPDKTAEIASILSAGSFRVYASDDINGVELGGALKNILAIGVGAARSMELGASAEAALIARGFTEITRLATALGAKRETLSGLSGLGDLVLTCSSTQSRNFSYGMALGRNDPLDDLPLAEGAFTAKVGLELAKANDVEVPIISSVVDVLEKRVTAREAVQQLLMRPLKHEKN